MCVHHWPKADAHGAYDGIDIRVFMRADRIVSGYPIYWSP
jgi:hypothetical protein